MKIQNKFSWPERFKIALLLVWVAGAAHSGAVERTSAKASPVAEDIFAQGYIPRIRIQISGAGLESLRQRPRTYVPATLREGNVVYTNVSIRLKGGPGSFRPLDDKPAFTLNFDRLAEGQKFHGLKKIHLNNSVQDSTYLAEKISRELFEAAGVPAPRAAHATVEVNGEALGFYVLIEGIDKQFLHRYFKDAKGNVYDGHSGSDVNHPMRTNSGENPKEQSQLRALAAAALEPNLETRLASLQKTLDLDRFISFLAVEVMICHWDGYALNRNNFRIFHDREKNQMVFIPQGTDQVFQRQNMTINPGMVGLVARSVMEIPEIRQHYRERMAQLLTNVFNIPAITNHLYSVATNVEPKLAVFDPPAAEGYLRRVSGFARRIQQRFNALERQLVPPSVATAKLDRAEAIPLTNWQPQTDLGNAR
ncbi:MAG: CotH kinase family protein, partial [Verrucomicrobia bacterium]|nr:CotH kinase family protein [Verrucomicrobiota bacterium]